MRQFAKYMLFALVKLVGEKWIKRVIPALAYFAGLDLLVLAYNEVGILKCENEMVSGEHFLISKILKNNLKNIANPVIFDVGANIGKYSLLLAKTFPQAKIYSFEPNQNTFSHLKINVGKEVNCVNLGMGAEDKTATIYTYSNNLTSSHASIYKDLFSTFHNTNDVVELDFQMTTIDNFCKLENVTCINFLKIDTEGNEYNVLKGAIESISARKIKIIQFEFGECDVFSRVFLQDFYTILTEYKIYRLDSNRLIPLFEYKSTNEIFRFQNFIAVRKDLPFLDGL